MRRRQNSPDRWAITHRRKADYLTAPEELFSGGSFLVDTPAERILCGLCHEAFALPYEKAQHLAVVHHAEIRQHIDADGVGTYEWRLP